MKKVLRAMIPLMLIGSAFGQTSAITATITDPDSQTWNNGTYTITFVPAPNTPQPSSCNGSTTFTRQYRGSLSSGGVLTVTVADNSFCGPPGSSWQFTLCSNTSAPCQNVNQIVTGATPNLSTQLSNAISAPRFGPGPNAFGYADAEVITSLLTPGSFYYSVTSGQQRVWSGSAWSGSGGGGTVTAVTASAPLASSGGSTPNITAANKSGNGTNLQTTNNAATDSAGQVATYDGAGNTQASTTLLSSLLVSGGALGTPSSGTATNLTGLPLSTGVTGQLPITAVGSAGLSGVAPMAISAAGAISVQNSASANVTAALGTDTKYFTASGSAATSGDVISGDAQGGIQDSGTLLSSLAPLASPTFTGTPAAPTPGTNINTTQIPTTAWVNTFYAPLASPTLTGTVTLSAIATPATNTNLTITPNGTGTTQFPNGSTTTPSFQAAGNSAGQGVSLLSSGGLCFESGSTVWWCSQSNGSIVGDGVSMGFSQTAAGSGTIGAAFKAIGTSTTEAMAPNGGTSTNLLLLPGNGCKITSAVTLSTTTAVICSWTLPNSAQTWAWECHGQYTITAGTTPGLTLQMNASQAPTAENGQATINITSATISGSSGSATSSSTGVQTILAGGSVGTTVSNADWSTNGTIQASATSGTFAIQGILTGTGTPAGTVLVGSTCVLL